MSHLSKATTYCLSVVIVSAWLLPPANATAPGSYLDVNGVHTYYERYGDGPPVLLLHGAAMVAESWKPQVEALAGRFQVIVPERRGVGRTADIDGPWSYQGMAEDTAAFLRALGLSRVAVIGLSDGGNIGLILAYSHPELVGALIVSGANQNAEALGEFAGQLAQMSAEELIASAPPEVAPWLEVHRAVSPDRGTMLLQTFEKMKRMWLDYALTDEDLARISVPTLVMAGDRDMFSVEHTMRIWAAIPNASLCIAPNATHFWLQTQPALANQVILSFLINPPAEGQMRWP